MSEWSVLIYAKRLRYLGDMSVHKSQYLCFPVKYVHSKMAISVKFLFLWVLSYQLDSDPNKTGSYSGDWWLFSFCHYNPEMGQEVYLVDQENPCSEPETWDVWLCCCDGVWASVSGVGGPYWHYHCSYQHSSLVSADTRSVPPGSTKQHLPSFQSLDTLPSLPCSISKVANYCILKKVN